MIKLLSIFLILLNFSVYAQSESRLSPAEYSIAKIAASTAEGDLDTLEEAINEGLDNGLTNSFKVVSF
ncbi:hypothetical protein [Gramella sp. KN1008]|uniref:hypothetical protein n=1 Tax=Gramella sp. KN1008 TaxID=2529298 RepID=UPI00103A30BB|nr:hypothetical protein [Gramella sp. KN1008]TBW26396.1 hypothetical protein EZJ28_14420 [Gramella sp. KN1008]